MYKLSLLAFGIFASSAFAQIENRPGAQGPNNLSLTAGFNTGGFTLGADYEFILPSTLGVGAYVREFPKETKDTNGADGLMIIGGMVAQHFYRQNWDFSLTPGVAIISIDSWRSLPASTTSLGPSLGIGLLCQVNASVAIGIENNRYWVWFDRDYNGLVRDDLSFKVRATF